MIKQLEPPSFFNIVTFTIGVNNWSIFVKKLKDLYIEHVQNLNIIYIYIYILQEANYGFFIPTKGLILA
jgi:hypothetical protein